LDDEIRAILSQIAGMLETGREYEQGAATRVRTALSGSQQALDDFLISNELWGGPGSIPDSAFVSDQTRLARFEEMRSSSAGFKSRAAGPMCEPNPGCAHSKVGAMLICDNP